MEAFWIIAGAPLFRYSHLSMPQEWGGSGMMGVGLDKVLGLGPWPNSRKITDWDRNMAAYPIEFGS